MGNVHSNTNDCRDHRLIGVFSSMVEQQREELEEQRRLKASAFDYDNYHPYDDVRV